MRSRVLGLIVGCLAASSVMLVSSPCFGTLSYGASVYSYTPGVGSTGSQEDCLGPWDMYWSNNVWYGHAVGIGREGSITVQMASPFVDGPGVDITVYEVGSSVGGANDPFDVYISTDGINLFFVGSSSGDHTSFDISGVASGLSFNYITVVDRDSTGLYDGADMDDFVGKYPVPEPCSLLLFGLGSSWVSFSRLLRRRR